MLEQEERKSTRQNRDGRYFKSGYISQRSCNEMNVYAMKSEIQIENLFYKNIYSIWKISIVKLFNTLNGLLLLYYCVLITAGI